jgi:DNA mismatch repair protein MutS2
VLKQRNNIAFRILELDTILEKVSELAMSSSGKEWVEGLFFLTEGDELKEELERVTEMRDLLMFDDPFPLQAFADLRPCMKKAGVVGAFLQPEDFVPLKQFLVMIRRVREYFDERVEKYPLLQEMVESIIPQLGMEKEIGRVIDSAGQVKDKASDDLFRLRRELNKRASQVRQRLESILQAMVSGGYAQEDTLVLREGRLVVPLRESYRGRLKGVVVDQSASGATVFIEPMEVLEMNNEIRRLRARERQEIERILKDLTDRVREHSHEIEANFEVAGRIDCLMARAKFSLRVRGNPARVDDNGILELKNARHPILLSRESNDEVVPLSLRMGGELRTLLITGPNAGGKTVALKTVGLLALMHQHGLHVPADEETSFPLFSQVFADIGDRQSIEQDLSTFSSHVGNIKTILKKADGRGLVLLDEIGSATDPAEGAALAEVVLRNLTQKGCLTIATTHMGMLKVFAQEEPGVENGSMAFDHKSLRPTYRFQMGIPGSSYAFEIAERLGLSKKLMEEAKRLVGEDRGELDRLILHLEENLQRTHVLLEGAEIEKSKLSGLVKLYQDRIDRLQKESEEKKRAILEEAEDVLREANTVVERVVREIRESQAGKESIRIAKEQLKTQKKRIEALSKDREKVEMTSFSRGDWVVWQGHNGSGRIVSEPDRTQRVLVQWNGVRLRVPVQELKPGGDLQETKLSSGLTSYRVTRDVSDEIDLRGMTVDEAIEAVEKYLGDAAVAGFTHVRIIHGKGTGILRRKIGEHLKNHPLTSRHRLGNWKEGDTGVTIVELK